MDNTFLLQPGKGVSVNGLAIHFGQGRDEIRKILRPLYGLPTSHRPDEDDYMDSQLRLVFEKHSLQALNSIELMGGMLLHDGLELFATRFEALEAALTSRYGKAPKWNGMLDKAECPELGLSFASRFHMGGDEGADEIEWVEIKPL